MKTYSVSMMCTNYLHLQEDLSQLDPLVDGYHIDIMDGQFVPNFAMNFDLIEAIQRVGTQPLDVHLMVHQPERYFDKLAALKVSGVVIHPETLQKPLQAVINQLRQLGLRVGIALSPGINPADYDSVLSAVDKVTVMMVHPGFAGQSMITGQLEVISDLANHPNRSFILELDGSTNETTAEEYMARGADQFIFGSSLFKAEDLAKRFTELKELFESKK